MESQEEEEVLIDYTWDSDIDGPMPGYARSPVRNNHSNYLQVSIGPVQDVPTAHRVLLG